MKRPQDEKIRNDDERKMYVAKANARASGKTLT